MTSLRRDHPDLSVADVERIVTCFFDAIIERIAAGGRVQLRGFGSFGTRHHKKRVARNPRSGNSVDVDAKRRPYFKASKLLLDRLNDTLPM